MGQSSFRPLLESSTGGTGSAWPRTAGGQFGVHRVEQPGQRHGDAASIGGLARRSLKLTHYSGLVPQLPDGGWHVLQLYRPEDGR